MLSGAGTCVVLIRWIRRAAFGGPAARARPCGHALGHALFIFRFLAGGSARTDGSLTGRAGRGLALSRRHERRAEEGRNDKSRDCKFGSHQEDLRRVTGSLQTSGRDLVPARDQHCANFIFKKIFGDRGANTRHFSKHPSPSEHRICAKRLQWFACFDPANVGQDLTRPDKGDAPCSWKVSRVLVV
jgi:hypothetical protein